MTKSLSDVENYQAFNNGYLQALAGRENDNPFMVGTEFHRLYEDGYEEAKDVCVYCGNRKSGEF